MYNNLVVSSMPTRVYSSRIVVKSTGGLHGRIDTHAANRTLLSRQLLSSFTNIWRVELSNVVSLGLIHSDA